VKKLNQHRILLCMITSVFFVAEPVSVLAENFVLQFEIPANDGSLQDITCGAGVTNCNGIGTDYLNDSDGTRFSQSTVSVDGVNYFHVIVGDPASGFAMESYTRRSGFGSPDSGGNERAAIGDVNVGNGIPNSGTYFMGNGGDPFGLRTPPAGFSAYDLSGNGTGDPSKTVFRMLVSDSEMSMEIIKPILDKKPLISQVMIDGDISSEFVLDMRGVGYDVNSIALPMINNLKNSDPDLPTPDAGNFDSDFSQDSNVTAGRFTYTPGTGWNTTTWDETGSQFDEGTYNYVGESGFDALNTDWSDFFDYAQNVAVCTSGQRAAITCPNP